MANVRFSVSGTSCIYLCFFILVGSVSANFLDGYLYSTDRGNFKEHQMIDIELLSKTTIHNLHKRDVKSSAENLNKTRRILNEKLRLINSLLPSEYTKKPVDKFTDIPIDKLNSDEAVDGEISPKDLKNNNITSVKNDSHIFYNSSIDNTGLTGKSFWVDMDNASKVVVHELLSNSHRRAATVKLSFEFPFYGRNLTNVTIATGGFVYTGNYVHSWLAATQYIAPLMANFDTSISNKSFVKYLDNGTSFTVMWEKVALQDKPTFEFTFQTTLHKNGDIVFVYKSVPLSIGNISEQYHPVKVGLSDAYILDRTLIFVRRKTIYEYHRVTFNKDEIKNWTVIQLTALPSCQDLSSCASCISNNINLNCTWCPNLQQCSSGQDRNRQNWMDNGCERSNISSMPYCTLYEDIMRMDDDTDDVEARQKLLDQNMIRYSFHKTEWGSSGYLALVILLLMVAGFVFWASYAYKYPQSTSGQILIRYRPSQWRWRRGEARYTAATIHM